MATIIRHRELVEKFEFTLFYEYKSERGSGYGFPCTEQGEVIQDSFHMDGVVERHKAFIADTAKLEHFKAPIIQRIDGSYIQPAVLKCDCGCEVVLYDPMDNVCDKCHAIYNSGGQRVRCLARDVDYLDAGERYEDDY